MSIRRFLSLAAAAAVALSLSSLPSAQAKAAPKPWIKFKTVKLDVGHPATILGAHLKPNTYYTLLLDIPNAKKPTAQGLFGPVKTDKHGSLKSLVQLPVVRKCGSAEVLAHPLGKFSYVTTKVTLINCTLKGVPKPPPAPGKPK